MAQVFEKLCYFSSKPFLKQLASHVSTAAFQLKFLGMKFFSHPSWALKHFLEGLEVFCLVLMKDKSSHF